jgi:hypothetical protein
MALMRATHESADRCLEAYDFLLGTQGGQAMHVALRAPAAQLQLYQSVLAVLTCRARALEGAEGGEGGGRGRVRGLQGTREQQALAEKCRVYKSMLPSLQVPTKEKHLLESAFDELRARIVPPADGAFGNHAVGGRY